MTDNRSTIWPPPSRPDWLQCVNDEARHMDIANLVPLNARELIETASRKTGLSDFGDDKWREPFEVLLKSLNEEADLHLFGRLVTRSEILLWLQTRLEIEATYKAHPEIEDEIIDAPVIVTGLGRSGTSILFELLAQDTQFGVPTSWEIMFPCPPPEKATYHDNPRIARANHLLTQWNRMAPTYQTMHEMGATIPTECHIAFFSTFVSENLLGLYQIPSYGAWLTQHGDMHYAYSYYKRILKLLQWKNPRKHWLMKAPSHLGYLPTLFEVFPDARVVHTHRDPIKVQASVTNLLGTLYWMRSDKSFDISAFEMLLKPEGTAWRLDNVIDQLERGEIPRSQIFDSKYADLLEKPVEAVRALYMRMGLALTDDTQKRLQDYLLGKPQGKFGKHNYSVGEREQIASSRAHFQRYQQYYNIPDEV